MTINDHTLEKMSVGVNNKFKELQIYSSCLDGDRENRDVQQPFLVVQISSAKDGSDTEKLIRSLHQLIKIVDYPTIILSHKDQILLQTLVGRIEARCSTRKILFSTRNGEEDSILESDYKLLFYCQDILQFYKVFVSIGTFHEL